MICKSGTLNLRNSQRGSPSCQCSTILFGQGKETMRFVFRILKNSRCTRRNSHRYTGRSSVLETKRRKVEFRSFTDSTAVQGNRSPSLHICQCSENAESKRNHTLQCGCFKHRTLVPNHSVCVSAQFNIYGAISNWSEQIRFDSGREGTRKNFRKRRIREQRNTKEREFTRCELLGVLSNASIWKQTAGKHSRLRITVRDCSIHRGLRTRIILVPVSAGMRQKTKPEENDGFGQLIPLCQDYTLSRKNPQSRPFAAIPGGTIIGPVIEVHVVQVCGTHGLENEIPSPNSPKRI